MKKLILSYICTAFAVIAMAQTKDNLAWNKLEVFRINKESPSAFFLNYKSFDEAIKPISVDAIADIYKNNSKVKLLNGDWKFAFLNSVNDVKEEFFAKNFDDPEELDCVIITHGRIVSEALSAADELAKEGIRVGIILLEVLKPYGDTAKAILGSIPNGACKLLFLEEEIKCGGMGMILSEELSKYEKLNNKSISIVAVDDTFVERHAGCSLYDDAHISAKYIIEAVKAGN